VGATRRRDPEEGGDGDHRRVLDESFGAQLQSRLVVRHDETTNHWGTVTSYSLGPHGKTALERGDVADVVARRLLD
jgi:hypothetical protein